jgi:type IV secretory pathway ATPase VirB11/archaellum biosynthesis ATPase
VAQEIEKVAPDLVSTTKVTLRPGDKHKTEVKQVNYGALIYIVINSVKQVYQKFSQEIQSIYEALNRKADKIIVEKKIQELEFSNRTKQTEIETLRQENSALKARLERIEKALHLE